MTLLIYYAFLETQASAKDMFMQISPLRRSLQANRLKCKKFHQGDKQQQIKKEKRTQNNNLKRQGGTKGDIESESIGGLIGASLFLFAIQIMHGIAATLLGNEWMSEWWTGHSGLHAAPDYALCEFIDYLHMREQINLCWMLSGQPRKLPLNPNAKPFKPKEKTQSPDIQQDNKKCSFLLSCND